MILLLQALGLLASANVDHYAEERGTPWKRSSDETLIQAFMEMVSVGMIHYRVMQR